MNEGLMEKEGEEEREGDKGGGKFAMGKTSILRYY